jgi:hypothetical protein
MQVMYHVEGEAELEIKRSMLPQPSYSYWGNTGRACMQMMYLVEGEAELVLDNLGAREDGNVLQIARLALTKAGCLHCNHLRTTSHDHDDMCSGHIILKEAGSDLRQCASVREEAGATQGGLCRCSYCTHVNMRREVKHFGG